MDPHTGLNNLDYAVIGIILLSGILAMFRGFIREVFSLISWTAAYFVAAKYHPLVEPWAHNYIKNTQAASLAAGVALFLVTLIALTVLGNAVADLMRGGGLTAIDRSLGFIFGLARGALVVCILYLAAVAIWWPDIEKPPEEQKSKPPTELADARTRPAMARGADFLKRFIPEKDIAGTADTFDKQTTELKREIDQQKLDMLSTPAVQSEKKDNAPAYDDKNRSNLNQLIEQKSAP